MSDMTANSPELAGRADKTDQRASEFVLRRYDRPVWTDSDQAELDAWLDESLSHRAAFWRLKAAWLRADRLNALRPLAPNDGTSLRGAGRTIGIKIAAALICVSGLASSYRLVTRPTMQTFTTGIGERRNLTLADGSKIELTTDTVLRIENDKEQRTAWLNKGEAYFQIAHDEAHPFVLHSARVRIVDLGTEFVARQEADGTRVTVVKGSVSIGREVSKSTPTVVLVPGESAFADARSIAVTRKSLSEIADTLGWRHGILIFRHTPLSQVVAEFNRYNHITLRVVDPRIAKQTISANLPATDVNVFARMAQNFLGLNVQRRGNEIELSNGQPPSTHSVEQQ